MKICDNQLTMQQHLIDTAKKKLQQKDKENVDIKNIRFHKKDEKQYALADVSYTWRLNAWVKNVKHQDMIFVLVNGEWESPLYY